MINKATWQRVKLGEVAEIVGGGTPKTSVPEYWGGDIAWLTPKDLTGYTSIYISKGERFITQEGLKNSSATIMPKGTILLSSRAPIGYVAIAQNDICTNQGFKSLICKKEKANNLFIYYWIKKNTQYLQSLGTGTTFGELSKNVVQNIEIPLPPLETQRKIAEILSSLDDKIDLLHRQNKTLESLALTLFRHSFIDNPNRNAWQIGKLRDYITPKKGKNITQKNAIKGIYPVIAGGLEPAYYHNQSNTQSPVITISASGANAGFVNIHYRPVWSSDSSYIDKTITPYVYFFYLFLKINQNILYDKQEGSAQPHIYPSHIMELEMPYCPKDLIETFESQMQIYFDKISHNMKEIQNLESLRDIMLPKLLSGEMEV